LKSFSIVNRKLIMEQQAREKRFVAGSSVVAAVFLTSAKLIVGVLTGSLGILAEAAHSGLDLAAAAITFFAVRVSDRPADESHMYGHGKVENLSALAETSLLLLTCIWIIYEAIHRLFFAVIEVNPSLWAFLIMAISMGVDFSRSRALARIARKYRSQALEADALHFSTDIWSSAVVILGLALVRYGEYRGPSKPAFERADAIAALIVAVIVITVSYRLGRRAVDALLDRAPKGLADRLSQSVQDVAGIKRVSRTRVRDLGNRVFVDMTVDVPRHLSFEESHELTEKVQQAVRTISPDADVVVHTEPVSHDESVIEKARSVAAREHVLIHNVSTHWTEKGVWIDLDVEVDSKLSFERAHELATNFEDKLRSELIRPGASVPVAGINAHIEPRSNEAANVGAPLSFNEADTYSERIHAIGRELDQTGSFHDIELHKIDGKVYLSFHMSLNVETPIAKVHSLAEEMESRLRSEFPNLGRVVIHTEPE
jgi:cation diffusion facilitator family transporter